MNLVATSNFRNTSPEVIDVTDPLHPNHIHKGARIQIGGDKLIDQLTAGQKRLVAELNAAGRIVDADKQKDDVKRIDAEVIAEKKQADAEKAAILKAIK